MFQSMSSLSATQVELTGSCGYENTPEEWRRGLARGYAGLCWERYDWGTMAWMVGRHMPSFFDARYED